jgi:Asp-tRNA(Asn)/Glu-tRNA(Gln) amidotransferase C subunit
VIYMSLRPVLAISDEELQRLADLAQLRLPVGAARQQLAEQLGKVLAYVSSVREYQPVVTQDSASKQSASLVTRPDIPQADALGHIGSNNRPQWLDESPLAEGQLVAVPGLFNNNGTSAT